MGALAYSSLIAHELTASEAKLETWLADGGVFSYGMSEGSLSAAGLTEPPAEYAMLIARNSGMYTSTHECTHPRMDAYTHRRTHTHMNTLGCMDAWTHGHTGARTQTHGRMDA